MLAEVKWDNEEQTIVHYTFMNGWAWADLYQVFQVGHELIISVPHKVDIIMDFSNASLLPHNALSHIQRAYKNPKPENVGLTVIISQNSFFETLVGAAQKMIRIENTLWQLKFVRSYADALELIKNSATPNQE